MPIQPGDRIPDVRLTAVTGGPTRSLSTDEMRFAAIVEDGVVRSLHVEPDVTKVTVSSAEAIVAELEARESPSP